MKVELVVNMAMNGEIVLAEQSNAYQAPQEISGMVFEKALTSGNIVLGKTTYQMFSQMINEMFPQLEVVVLSSSNQEGNATFVDNAEKAVEYLENKGFKTATVAGGTKTYNAFLTDNLVDDIYMNLFPVMIHNGGHLQPEKDITIDYKIESCHEFNGVIKLHYAK